MERQPDESVDLRGTTCPMNWVKTRLQLEEMEPGQLLELVMDDGDPVLNITKNLRSEGHKVIAATPEDPAFRLVVEIVARSG